MAGFSLGGNNQQIAADSGGLFFYTSGGGTGALGGCGRQSGEISTYTKGFELWAQQQQIRHHQQQEPYVGGIGMLPDDPAGSADGGGAACRRVMRSGVRGGGMSCRDCGNQAKKDCMHMRCRTCCRSRGFRCVTHIKSTWVPAAKRRDRQQQQSQLIVGGGSRPGNGGEQFKRPREMGFSGATGLPSAALTVMDTSATSALEAATSFPSVSKPALFRCVRMVAPDELEDQYAYQTAVSIGGRVFTGTLFDQGPESQHTTYQVDASSSSAVVGAAAGAATGAAAVGVSTVAASVAAAASPMLDLQATLYPTPLSAFMAGTQFFPQSRVPHDQ